ncbi:MAG: ornithine carbamoyltransferase [Deferribacterales bacterium]|nr:ornithine carbamoyltransferase [Deferribacterales bacterium]
MKRDFLTLLDYTTEELQEMLNLAIKLKEERKKNVDQTHYMKGKKVALIFEKSSTRTRVSFEVGVFELGGYPLFLSKNDLQLGRGETIADTARTLSRYVDMIMIRTFEHKKLEELAKYASIPVINGLTDDFHPCQVLADIMTIYEKFNKLNGIKVAFIGDGNNMANSWLIGAAKFGINFSLACPKGYEPKSEVVELAKKIAKNNNCHIEILNDPLMAVQDADIVYTDVWASMGQEEEAKKRAEAFKDFQVNEKLIKATNKKTYFMHCLPAHRGEEVTDDVIESDISIVFDEAENRLHAQKAIMVKLIN